MISLRKSISRDHPAFKGHFPEQKILPAYALLDVIVSSLNNQKVTSITDCKFISPIFPGDELEIGLTWKQGKLDFVVSSNGETKAKGSMCYIAS